jgi:hypothetical protein
LILDLDKTLISTEIIDLKPPSFSYTYDSSYISPYLLPIIKLQNKKINKFKTIKNLPPKDKSSAQLELELELTSNIDNYKLCEFDISRNKFIVYMRNYLLEFLLEMETKFNLYVYTNATIKYTQNIIGEIHNKIGKNIFVGYVSRKYSFSSEIKSLYVLSEHVFISKFAIIIDDRDDVWCEEDKQNLIKIEEYSHKPISRHFSDKELLIMIDKIENKIFSF